MTLHNIYIYKYLDKGSLVPDGENWGKVDLYWELRKDEMIKVFRILRILTFIWIWTDLIQSERIAINM